jgi:hypothetical protein
MSVIYHFDGGGDRPAIGMAEHQSSTKVLLDDDGLARGEVSRRAAVD